MFLVLFLLLLLLLFCLEGWIWFRDRGLAEIDETAVSIFLDIVGLGLERFGREGGGLGWIFKGFIIQYSR